MSSAGGGAEIVPTERRTAFALRTDGQLQSYVDLADPLHLAFDYVRRLGDVLDVVDPPGEPLRVVHVGGAAMSLPRYVAATRPRSSQIVLEPDTETTEQVRAHLPLPPRSGIKVRPQDGRTGLGALRPDSAEVILVDAFDRGRVPADLVTVEAFTTMRGVLLDGGLLLFNLVDRAPFSWSRRALAAGRSVFDATALHVEPAVLKGRRAGNVLLLASTRQQPLDTVHARLRGRQTGFRVLAGTQVGDFFGGGVPFTDSDSEASGAP
ncbi:fused MFS/spermidine synthase [Nocardioides sp. 616]|uniref:spermidine synthase n=1 Tax=Nocardioides sp. 616 TaxID=2268090 RepID=UPI000CE49B5B|nr:fused MFS/spermidine synthase [Nocardioides sp. 616]